MNPKIAELMDRVVHYAMEFSGSTQGSCAEARALAKLETHRKALVSSIEALETELAKWKLEWKTGKIPEENLYWLEGWTRPVWMPKGYAPLHRDGTPAKWAGPIPQPGEKP